jgi:hypothetical protein
MNETIIDSQIPRCTQLNVNSLQIYMYVCTCVCGWHHIPYQNAVKWKIELAHWIVGLSWGTLF